MISAGRFKAIDRVRRRARFDAKLLELASGLETETADMSGLDPESARDVRGMIIGAMLVLALIGGYVWFVTTHKRRIAASRLSCQRCGYVPHDTEIDEVAESHRCPHCAGEL